MTTLVKSIIWYISKTCRHQPSCIAKTSILLSKISWPKDWRILFCSVYLNAMCCVFDGHQSLLLNTSEEWYCMSNRHMILKCISLHNYKNPEVPFPGETILLWINIYLIFVTYKCIIQNSAGSFILAILASISKMIGHRHTPFSKWQCRFQTNAGLSLTHHRDVSWALWSCLIMTIMQTNLEACLSGIFGWAWV